MLCFLINSEYFQVGKGFSAFRVDSSIRDRTGPSQSFKIKMTVGDVLPSDSKPFNLLSSLVLRLNTPISAFAQLVHLSLLVINLMALEGAIGDHSLSNANLRSIKAADETRNFHS